MSSEAFVVEAGTGSAQLLLGEVFRTLVSGTDSGGALGFVTMVGPAGRPIPMHRHGEAHDVFFCDRGAIQVWFDGESRVLHPGDMASVPPGTLHAYRLLRGDRPLRARLRDEAAWLRDEAAELERLAGALGG